MMSEKDLAQSGSSELPESDVTDGLPKYSDRGYKQKLLILPFCRNLNSGLFSIAFLRSREPPPSPPPSMAELNCSPFCAVSEPHLLYA